MKKITLCATTAFLALLITLTIAGCSNSGSSKSGVASAATQAVETTQANVLSPEENAALNYFDVSSDSGATVNVISSETNSDGNIYYYCNVIINGEQKDVVVQDGGVAAYSPEEYDALTEKLEKE